MPSISTAVSVTTKAIVTRRSPHWKGRQAFAEIRDKADVFHRYGLRCRGW